MPEARKRPCTICRRWFRPNPRVGSRQRACGNPECQAARRQKKMAAVLAWPGADDSGPRRRGDLGMAYVRQAERDPQLLAAMGLLDCDAGDDAAARPLLAAAPVLFAVWALAGFYGSLGPSLIAHLVGSTAVVDAGLGIGVLAGVSALGLDGLARFLRLTVERALEFAAASEDVARTSHPHPTRSEASRQAAMGVEGWTMQA